MLPGSSSAAAGAAARCRAFAGPQRVESKQAPGNVLAPLVRPDFVPGSRQCPAAVDGARDVSRRAASLAFSPGKHRGILGSGAPPHRRSVRPPQPADGSRSVTFVNLKSSGRRRIPEVHRRPSRRSSEHSSSRASRIRAPAGNGAPSTCKGLSRRRRDRVPARANRAIVAALSSTSSPAGRHARAPPDRDHSGDGDFAVENQHRFSPPDPLQIGAQAVLHWRDAGLDHAGRPCSAWADTALASPLRRRCLMRRRRSRTRRNLPMLDGKADRGPKPLPAGASILSRD